MRDRERMRLVAQSGLDALLEALRQSGMNTDDMGSGPSAGAGASGTGAGNAGAGAGSAGNGASRSEEHTSELQSP